MSSLTIVSAPDPRAVLIGFVAFIAFVFGVPVLATVLSQDGAQSFMQMCPHAEYVNVTDAGHMVAGDRNDIFGNAVIQFLARTVPVGRR